MPGMSNIPLRKTTMFASEEEKTIFFKEASNAFEGCNKDLDTLISDPILALSIKNCCEVGLKAIEEGSTCATIGLIRLLDVYLDRSLGASTTAH